MSVEHIENIFRQNNKSRCLYVREAPIGKEHSLPKRIIYSPVFF